MKTIFVKGRVILKTGVSNLQLTFFVSQTHSQMLLFLLGFDNNYFQAFFE